MKQFTELEIAHNINWPKLADKISDKIKMLGGIALKLKDDKTGRKIAKDLILPALAIIKAFDETVTITEHDGGRHHQGGMKKRIAPSHDFPFVSTTFNLLVEQTQDGERIEREKQQAEADRAEAETKQQELEV